MSELEGDLRAIRLCFSAEEWSYLMAHQEFSTRLDHDWALQHVRELLLLGVELCAQWKQKRAVS